MYVPWEMECFTIVLFLSDSSRTFSGSRILPNILDYVKESDIERVSARQNQSGWLGLKARLITLSSLGNRRAAAQILACTLG